MCTTCAGRKLYPLYFVLIYKLHLCFQSCGSSLRSFTFWHIRGANEDLTWVIDQVHSFSRWIWHILKMLYRCQQEPKERLQIRHILLVNDRDFDDSQVFAEI